MAGPGIPSNTVIGSEGSPVGRVTDAMATVADILGVGNEVNAFTGSLSLLQQM